MSIITKPATIEKNLAATVILNKSELAAIIPDIYYADSANWKEVFIYYKSSTGNQREILKFNATLSSPIANFLVSDRALDVFQVQKIVIVDFDAGNITIPRSELTVTDFDVNMTPAEFFYLRDFSNPNSFGVDETGMSGNSPSSIENNMLLVGGNSITPLGTYLNNETLTFKAGYTYTIRFYIESLTLVNDGISNPMLAHFDVYGASNGIGTVYEPELSNSITGVGYAERSFIGTGSTVTDITWGIYARYCKLSISKVAIIEIAP